MSSSLATSCNQAAALGPSYDQHDDSNPDAMPDDVFNQWLADRNAAADLYQAQTTEISRKSVRQKKQSKPAFKGTSIPLDSFQHGNLLLEDGVTVELVDSSFLKISRVLKKLRGPGDERIFLLGQIFQRNKNLKGQLPMHLNEVCWMQYKDMDKAKDLLEQSVRQISVNEVLRERLLLKTNTPYPTLGHRFQAGQPRAVTKNHGVLVCRRKVLCCYVDKKARRKGDVYEESHLELQQTECDDVANSMPCYESRELWRGPTEIGGSCKEWLKGEKEFLRQESVCTKGKICLDPLESDTYSWPPEDVMNGRLVGTLLTESEIPEVMLRGERSMSPEKHLPDFDMMDEDMEPDIAYRKRSSEEEDSPTPKRSRIVPEIDSYFSTPRRHALEAVQSVTVQENRMSDDDWEALPSGLPDGAKARNQQVDRKDGARLPNHALLSLESTADSRYTFGDAFCCAGGMSRAAVMAGLRVTWGFDHDIDACESYLMNNFGTRVYKLWADQFLRLPEKYNLRVDVLHISPPCQFFSPAHTREGKDDEQNTASQTAIQELLDRCRPRVVIVEQTMGLARARKHRPWFNTLIAIFTTKEFNLRWRVLHCADYGVPQTRRRLFIIASCPGEPLPPFPEPTFSKVGANGLAPWVTINDAINDIPFEWPDHEIDACIARNQLPVSGDRLSNTILTKGDGTIHPSGERDYTDREVANLQTFPLCHKFSQKQVRKQIGNAVPPAIGKAILEAVVHSMKVFDGLLPE